MNTYVVSVSDNDNANSKPSDSDDDWPDLPPEVLDRMLRSDRQNYKGEREIFKECGFISDTNQKWR